MSIKVKVINGSSSTTPVETTLRTPRDGKDERVRVLKVNGFNNFSFTLPLLHEVIKATSQRFSKNLNSKTRYSIFDFYFDYHRG